MPLLQDYFTLNTRSSSKAYKSISRYHFILAKVHRFSVRGGCSEVRWRAHRLRTGDDSHNIRPAIYALTIYPQVPFTGQS